MSPRTYRATTASLCARTSASTRSRIWRGNVSLTRAGRARTLRWWRPLNMPASQTKTCSVSICYLPLRSSRSIKTTSKACSSWQPWIERLVDAGGKVLAFDADISVTTLQPWVVRTEWLAKNPDAARRLIAVAERARQQLATDSSVGVREVAGVLKISEEAAKRIYERDVILSAAMQGIRRHVTAWSAQTASRKLSARRPLSLRRRAY